MNAAATLMNVLALVQAGVDITATATDMYGRIKSIQDAGREPTAQEWDAINGIIKPLRDELHRA